MSSQDKPYFTDKMRAKNPILSAEDLNGFFQADRRQRTLYGSKLNHLFGQKTNEYGTDKPSVGDVFKAVTKPYKMIRSDNEELYLTGVNGRDILEARYLQLALINRQAPFVVSFVISVIGLIIAFFLNWMMVSTWVMAISLIILVREIICDASFIGAGAGASAGNSELQKWRQKKAASDQLAQLMVDLLKIGAGVVVVFFVLTMMIFLISAIAVLIGELFLPTYKSFLQYHSPYWMESNFTYFPQLIITFFAILMTFILILTRQIRRDYSIRTALKNFESGRKEYDQYMLCAIIKDLPDAVEWLRFYYERAPASDYDHHVSQGRPPEQPSGMIHGFDPHQAAPRQSRHTRPQQAALPAQPEQPPQSGSAE